MEEYRDNLYTRQQSKILTLIPIFPASLSVIGSATIIYIILSDRKRKLQRVYHRLLLAYSSVDLIFSLNLGLSALVVPVGAPGVWGAISGNQATCDASGLVTQFGQSNGMYASFMCLYYVLILRYNVREETIAKRIEPFLHIVAFVYPLVFASLMISWGMYNPTNVVIGWCFINVYPADCLRRDEVTCERGEDYYVWLMINNAPFFVYLVVVVASCILTWLKVRSLELRTSSRWSFNRQAFNKTRETSIQSFLYIASFFLSYSFFGIATLGGPTPATEQYRNFYFPLVLLLKIFLPLQGFWNFFIFVRPRYCAIKRRFPAMRPWHVMRQIIFVSSEGAQRRQQQESLKNKYTGSRLPENNVNNVVQENDEFTPEIDNDEKTANMVDISDLNVTASAAIRIESSSLGEEDVVGNTNSKKEEVAIPNYLHRSQRQSVTFLESIMDESEFAQLAREIELEDETDRLNVTSEATVEQFTKGTVAGSPDSPPAFTRNTTKRMSLFSPGSTKMVGGGEGQNDESSRSRRASVDSVPRPRGSRPALESTRSDADRRRSMALLEETMLGIGEIDIPSSLSPEADQVSLENKGTSTRNAAKRMSLFSLWAKKEETPGDAEEGLSRINESSLSRRASLDSDSINTNIARSRRYSVF